MAWFGQTSSLPGGTLTTWAAWPLRLLRRTPGAEDAVERLASQLAAQDHSHLGWLDAGIWGRVVHRATARETLLRAVAVSGDEVGQA
jgi:hypothetical protein